MHEPNPPTATHDHPWPRGGSRRLAWAIVFLIVALIVAARLIGLDRAPPGFAVAEARGALAARSIGGDFLPLLPDPTRGHGDAPLFLWVVRLIGELAGWGVAGPRLAAALRGLLTVAGCALWHRRALGTVWSIAGALLVGTSFWQLMFSRQAAPEIATAAGAAIGLWCLWEGNSRTPAGSRWHAAWYTAAGAAIALGAYAGPAGFVMLPAAVVIGAVLAWRGAERRDRTGLPVALATLLLVAAPLIGQTLSDPDRLRQRFEQDWNRDGTPEQVRGPADGAVGYAISARSIMLLGYDAQAVNLPGRPLLDPMLAGCAILGLLVLVRRPGDRLHATALLWLCGSLVTPALVAPGHPGLLLPATPVLFLLPLLGLRAIHGRLIARRGTAARLAPVVVAVALVVTSGWSLYDYFVRWSGSAATYHAFHGDVRASLDAASELPGAAPISYATNPAIAPIVATLAPDRALHTFDSRNSLPLPAEGGRFLVFSRSAQPPATLLRYLAGQPSDVGTTPDGEPAWQVWRVGQPTRQTLPYTLPVIHFPEDVDLIGFDVAPDLGDVEATGRLPDPPRMRVTLVWRVPYGAPPLVARARLAPADRSDEPRLVQFADVPISAAPPTPDASGQHELLVVELIVVVPSTPDRVADVQVGLLTADGTLLPPTGPTSGGYAYLNRVQYVAE
jgi:4-amino-4-deoxy-L-arabinose transferase-like glycosyltransferase